ncbi:MAG: hypothetical protein ACO1TE_00645 [Prosthecobacter sp.]
MGVAAKHRRKITVGDERYLWYVAEEDAAGMVLNVISADKRLMVKFQLDQPVGEEYIVILGRRFAGAQTGSGWSRFRCPRFAELAITPQIVRDLVDWCLDGTLPREVAEWRSWPVGA